jgi:hypothetical protein
MPKLEQLLLVAVGVVLLPMTLYSAYLAALAFGESARLAAAPRLVPGASAAGTFYRVEGPLAGALLAPPEYPEVKEALQIRATHQVRPDTLTEAWTDDAAAPVRFMRAEQVTVGGVPVELHDSTRIMAPVAGAFHQESPTARTHLHYRPVAGVNFVLFGWYERGAIRDGRYDRVLLVTADQAAAAVEAAGSVGQLKGFVLAAIATVLFALGALTVRAVFNRRSVGRRD